MPVICVAVAVFMCLLYLYINVYVCVFVRLLSVYNNVCAVCKCEFSIVSYIFFVENNE